MITNAGYILIVDDVASNLEVQSRGLTARGYTVRTAVSGQRALEMVADSPPELILLDILMPGMDGYEVLRQLKRDPRLRDIPVIFLSALNETVDRVKGLQLGAVDYLSKPFDFEEVYARLETHLTLYRQRQQIEELLAQREQAEASERQQRLFVKALLDSAIALSSTLDLDEILQRILLDVGQVVPHDMALIVLVEHDQAWVASFHSTLPNRWRVPPGKIPVSEIGIIQTMRDTRRPHIIADTQITPLWLELSDQGALR